MRSVPPSESGVQSTLAVPSASAATVASGPPLKEYVKLTTSFTFEVNVKVPGTPTPPLDPYSGYASDATVGVVS